MSYPDKNRILKVLDDIQKRKLKPTVVIEKNASPIDKMKFNICQKIIKFKRIKNYSNKDISEIIGVGPAVISRVLHCQIDRFKIDSLLIYYLCLVTSSQDKKLIKKFDRELEGFLADDAA
ncbi:MAG: hypothetical protein OXB88_04465 [Bacteriovoracales bacterium]|nr:hypothetical protein [Bacteriovoracales bacterium]